MTLKDKSRCILIMLLPVALSGCHLGILGKRNSELCCPTDIRKTHVWPYGEDAIFDTPCGPDHEYFGHKPTCWRDWPSSGADWRDGTCGGCITCAPGIEGSVDDPEPDPHRLPQVHEQPVETVPPSLPNIADPAEADDDSSRAPPLPEH